MCKIVITMWYVSQFFKMDKKKEANYLYIKLKKKVDLSLFYIIRVILWIYRNIASPRVFIVRFCVRAIEREYDGELWLWYSTIILRDRSIDRSRINHPAIRRDCVSNIIALAGIVSCSRNAETCPIAIVNQNGQRQDMFIFMSFDYYIIHLL